MKYGTCAFQNDSLINKELSQSLHMQDLSCQNSFQLGVIYPTSQRHAMVNVECANLLKFCNIHGYL